MTVERTIGIAGAGSIGCFVGGMLAAGGRQIALLARPRVIAEIESNGLRLTSFEGLDRRIAEDQLTLSENPSIFSDAGVVLVTVKSADTAGIADVIARHAPHDAVIVSLQNGVGNVGVLRERLPGRIVLGGMVPFNVISAGQGRFHRSTSGDIVIEADDAATAERLSVPGLKLRATAGHIRRAMGQAAGQSQQRAQRAGRAAAAPATGAARHGAGCSPTRWRRGWRRCGLMASRRCRRRRCRQTGHRICCGCRMRIFNMVLGRTMKIDPEARSSMWEDLQRGRATEIDYLQGVITEIADRHGLQVPLSRRIVALIRNAEQAGKGSPGLTPEQIRDAPLLTD